MTKTERIADLKKFLDAAQWYFNSDIAMDYLPKWYDEYMNASSEYLELTKLKSSDMNIWLWKEERENNNFWNFKEWIWQIK